MHEKICWAIFRGNNIIFTTIESESTAEIFRDNQVDSQDLVLAYKRNADDVGVWRVDALYKPGDRQQNYILVRQGKK